MADHQLPERRAVVRKLIAPALAIFLAPIALTLAGCGQNEQGGSPAQPVAEVAPPAGTSWSQTLTATDDGHFLMGNPDAAVQLVEYASYTCNHCADFSAAASEEIRAIVDSGRMNFELRPFVRDPIDISTALLARCAGKDIFYPLSEQFFANQEAMFEKAQGLADARYQQMISAPPQQRFNAMADALGLVDFAKQRGIAEDQARQCLADSAEADRLVKGVEAANSRHRISGTPSFLINGVLVDNVTTWPAVRAKLKEAGI